MKPKIVLYTALFGNYSGLIEQPKLDNIDFLCYTDQNMTSDSWKIINVAPPVKDDNTRSNRYYKILPHKHLKAYDISIYIDANFLILEDFTTMVLEKLKNHTMACFDHNQTILDPRNCIYDEYEELLRIAKADHVYRDAIEVMESQIAFIKNENYPKNNGLISAGVLIRKHNDKDTIALMELWWDFVKNKSKRDQLSFNYAMWKLNFKKLTYLEGDIRRGNPWFYWIDHKQDFSKDLKKIKKQRFFEKYYPNFLRPSKNKWLFDFLFYANLPILLIKLNKWSVRYATDTLSIEDKKALKQKVLSKKLSKAGIIDEINVLNGTKKEERLTYWNHYLDNILEKKQGSPNLKIAKKSNFTAVIVEARKHPHFKVVVENVILNTQHLDVCLRVYHGIENEKFVKDCLKMYANIEFINLNVKNLDIEAYNKIMLSKEFYQNISSEHILTFQTDVITFKPLDKHFFDYDYVGAPWHEKYHKEYKADVGNGGLSLRSKKAMLAVLELGIDRKPFFPEDLYLAQILKRQNFKVAPFNIAAQFGVEEVFTPTPFGCHKCWQDIKMDQLKQLLN